MKKQKYSLNQRKSYWKKELQDEVSKNGYGNLSAKSQYASGFLKGAESGCSKNFNKLPKPAKAGQLAGQRARDKAHNIKFN
ncbi:MAG: hypothetical protein E7184_00200 [Erysipelotrichaceae bacterium]|nr:hypothetical protein [Erysipelotrichaceae bacterium]